MLIVRLSWIRWLICSLTQHIYYSRLPSRREHHKLESFHTFFLTHAVVTILHWRSSINAINSCILWPQKLCYILLFFCGVFYKRSNHIKLVTVGIFSRKPPTALEKMMKISCCLYIRHLIQYSQYYFLRKLQFPSRVKFPSYKNYNSFRFDETWFVKRNTQKGQYSLIRTSKYRGCIKWYM